MISSLTDILDTACITLSIRGRKKPEIIRELVDLLHQAGKIENPAEVAERVLERESLTSTGIGGGIAIPHGTSANVGEMVMAFGRHRPGLKFDAVDRRPVQLFFLIVAPEGAQTEHLQVLSKISRYLHDPNFKNGLLEAESPEEIIRLMADRKR
jgi:PTS system fructose-specific IIC component